MKHNILIFALSCIFIAFGGAYADGIAETETVTIRERITVDTVRVYDDAYVPQTCRNTNPCRAASSMDVGRRCGCKKHTPAKPAPIRVKTYTEVIDHYQVYEPVITYKPAGTYTTRRYVQSPNPRCGTCKRK